MRIYRRIYEKHFGPIPIDNEGRTYDIHHIDGNRKNNHPPNLIAVTIQQHYDIHYSQGDFAACHRIAAKMKMSPADISRIASEASRKSVEDGTHNFLGGEMTRKNNQQRLADGTHNLLGGAQQRKRVQDGTHHFLDRDAAKKRQLKLIANGSHHFLSPQKVTCPHCGKTGGNNTMHRWHFTNCKSEPSRQLV